MQVGGRQGVPGWQGGDGAMMKVGKLVTRTGGMDAIGCAFMIGLYQSEWVDVSECERKRACVGERPREGVCLSPGSPPPKRTHEEEVG